jgi:hypothetical protein
MTTIVAAEPILPGVANANPGDQVTAAIRLHPARP